MWNTSPSRAGQQAAPLTTTAPNVGLLLQVMFYAPQLFSAMGSSRQHALLTHVIIGAVNVATTFVAVFTVDSIGRWALGISATCTELSDQLIMSH